MTLSSTRKIKNVYKRRELGLYKELAVNAPPYCIQLKEHGKFHLPAGAPTIFTMMKIEGEQNTHYFCNRQLTLTKISKEMFIYFQRTSEKIT